MYLKCIGGPWSGRIVTIESSRPQITVRELVSPVAAARIGPSRAPELEPARYRETLYVRDDIHSDEGTISFLRPADQTAHQVLSELLEPK